ncbi:MAG: AMP-binding protein [Proteobacteria bacterium]|nr:AMP-binding protein [Pseudomonadota bacterium]
MERIWMKNWPSGVPAELTYRIGQKPLFEYLRHNARETPDKAAYIFYGREITWAELDRYTDRFAAFLSSVGLGKGDKVMLFMQNCPQYVVAHFGAQKLGAIVVPANPMFKEMELEYEANDVGAAVIVTTDDLYPTLEKVRDQTGIKEVVITNYRDMAGEESPCRVPEELQHEKRAFDRTRDLMDILENGPIEYPAPEIDIREDVAMIVYTSGTTGRPKGAMLTYGNALFKGAAASSFYQVVQDEVFLAVMPICHIAGNVLGVVMPAYSGGTVVLLTRFEPDVVMAVVDRYKCSHFYGVTPMLLAMMGHPDAGKYDLSSIKRSTITSFGIALTEEIAGSWRDFSGGAPVAEAGYGLSETHTCDVFMPMDKIRYGPNGIPVFETDMRIVDPATGEEKPVGEQGEIIIRNAGVFKGYLNNPEGTAATLRNGWVYTGDVGRFDEEGYLYFLGRFKEMIKCSGYSVFPEDVEVMLLKHPAVLQAAVIGVPDPTRGESVKAFIVLKPEYKDQVTPEDIIAWSKENMAAYKYPRAVVFRDSMPTTGAGKVLRRLLKEE